MSVIMITGCSSGFGLESALAFARNKDTVIATMRDMSKKNALRSRAESETLEIQVRQLDVSISAEFTNRINDIVDEHGRIDVLINNAGIHRQGAFEDVSESEFRNVMETNCIGPLLLTRAVLPTMRRQRSGLIIMISSLSGIAGLPGDLPYAASKFALEGATEALRHEVDHWGIDIALVQAGLHKTNILSHGLASASLLPDDYPMDSPYRPLIEWQLRDLPDRLQNASDPRDLAELLVSIRKTDRPKLRWPAGPLAERVLSTMLAQNDLQRDEYLRQIAGSDWWSQGKTAPD